MGGWEHLVVVAAAAAVVVVVVVVAAVPAIVLREMRMEQVRGVEASVFVLTSERAAA